LTFSSTKADNFWIIVAALIAVITSILQYILDYKVRWKTHERAGKGYAALNREIEELLSIDAVGAETVTVVRAHYDHLTDSSPAVPALFWDRPKELTDEIVRREKRDNGQPTNEISALDSTAQSALR
jgi:hypothetical protein